MLEAALLSIVVDFAAFTAVLYSELGEVFPKWVPHRCSNLVPVDRLLLQKAQGSPTPLLLSLKDLLK